MKVSRRFAILAFVGVLLIVGLASSGCLSNVATDLIAKSTEAAPKAATGAESKNTAASDKNTTVTDNNAAVSDKAQTKAAPSQAAAQASPQTLPANSNASDLEGGSIIKVVKMVRPAVVNITTQQIAYDFYLRPIPE